MPTFCRWVVLRYVCFIMRTPDHKIIQVENMKNIIAEINDYKEKGILLISIYFDEWFIYFDGRANINIVI